MHSVLRSSARAAGQGTWVSASSCVSSPSPVCRASLPPAAPQLQCFIAEGVPHDSVVFEDNAPLLELFEHKQMGVFAQLSEACMYPRPNDSGLVTKLGALHAR